MYGRNIPKWRPICQSKKIIKRTMQHRETKTGAVVTSSKQTMASERFLSRGRKRKWGHKGPCNMNYRTLRLRTPPLSIVTSCAYFYQRAYCSESVSTHIASNECYEENVNACRGRFWGLITLSSGLRFLTATFFENRMNNEVNRVWIYNS